MKQGKFPLSSNPTWKSRPQITRCKIYYIQLEGGIQSQLNSKERELLNKNKDCNLERFEKRDVEITPCKKFEETLKTSSLYRFPILLG